MQIKKNSIYLLAGILAGSAAVEVAANPFNKRFSRGDSFDNFVEDARTWGGRGFRSRFSLVEPTPSKPIFKAIKAEPFVALRNTKLEFSVPENEFAQIIFSHLTGKAPITVTPAAYNPGNEAVVQNASYEPGQGTKLTNDFIAPEPIRVHANDRDSLIDFYAERDFKPLWIEGGKLTKRAINLLEYLQTVEEHGLKKSDYQISLLNGFSKDISHLSEDKEALGLLELKLSRSAVAYARHASAGRVIPEDLSRFNTMEPEQVMPAEALTQIAQSETPGIYLERLQPNGPRYLGLKKALKEHREKAKEQTWERIPAGKTLKPGMNHGRIVLLRKRLEAAGLYEMPVMEPKAVEKTASEQKPTEKIEAQQDTSKNEVQAQPFDPAFFDDELRNAVRAFQEENNLHPDGYVGRRTLAKLNAGKKDRVQQIILNMERLRWLPQELGKRHIFVNQAEYRMRVIDEGQEVHSARVIIGKYRHQTPVFQDEMETVVLNPYWNVPQSIIKNELLPSGNLGGYEIFQGGKRISAYDIDYPGERLHIRQPPGPRNALGYVKFLFPNQHAVYMHDTPKRHLFSRENRTFSHGCIRVHHAQKLAHVVLGLDQPEWTPEKITAGIKNGGNQHIQLNTKIPVYITYMTAWVDENGVLKFSDDFYGRDKHLTTVMNTYQDAQK